MTCDLCAAPVRLSAALVAAQANNDDAAVESLVAQLNTTTSALSAAHAALSVAVQAPVAPVSAPVAAAVQAAS